MTVYYMHTCIERQKTKLMWRMKQERLNVSYSKSIEQFACAEDDGHLN